MLIFVGPASFAEKDPARHGINLLSTLTLAASFLFSAASHYRAGKQHKEGGIIPFSVEIDGTGAS
jgi:hypothetical protein